MRALAQEHLSATQPAWVPSGQANDRMGSRARREGDRLALAFANRKTRRHKAQELSKSLRAVGREWGLEVLTALTYKEQRLLEHSIGSGTRQPRQCGTGRCVVVPTSLLTSCFLDKEGAQAHSCCCCCACWSGWLVGDQVPEAAAWSTIVRDTLTRNNKH